MSGTTVSDISQLSIPSCQDATTATAGCGPAVTSTATQFVGTVGDAQTPTTTDCPSNMAAYDTCQAQCQAGEITAGRITCFNGTMLGKSVCGEGAGISTVQQYAVRGTLTVVTTDAVNLPGVKSAIASYLGVPEDDVIVVLKEVETSGSNQVNHINYEVRVADGSTANTVASSMSAVNADGTTPATTMTNRLSANGVSVVSGLASSAAPVQTDVLALNNQPVNPPIPAGDTPATPAPTPAPTSPPAPPPSEEEDSSNTGAIVGGVIGGIVGLGLIAGGIYFCMTRKTMAEA